MARLMSSTSSNCSSAIRRASSSWAMPSSTRPVYARAMPRLHRAWPSTERPSGTRAATAIASRAKRSDSSNRSVSISICASPLSTAARTLVGGSAGTSSTARWYDASACWVSADIHR